MIVKYVLSKFIHEFCTYALDGSLYPKEQETIAIHKNILPSSAVQSLNSVVTHPCRATSLPAGSFLTLQALPSPPFVSLFLCLAIILKEEGIYEHNS